jgi:hypothetical protein
MDDVRFALNAANLGSAVAYFKTIPEEIGKVILTWNGSVSLFYGGLVSTLVTIDNAAPHSEDEDFPGYYSWGSFEIDFKTLLDFEARLGLNGGDYADVVISENEIAFSYLFDEPVRGACRLCEDDYRGKLPGDDYYHEDVIYEADPDEVSHVLSMLTIPKGDGDVVVSPLRRRFEAFSYSGDVLSTACVGVSKFNAEEGPSPWDSLHCSRSHFKLAEQFFKLIKEFGDDFSYVGNVSEAEIKLLSNLTSEGRERFLSFETNSSSIWLRFPIFPGDPGKKTQFSGDSLWKGFVEKSGNHRRFISVAKTLDALKPIGRMPRDRRADGSPCRYVFISHKKGAKRIDYTYAVKDEIHVSGCVPSTMVTNEDGDASCCGAVEHAMLMNVLRFFKKCLIDDDIVLEFIPGEGRLILQDDSGSYIFVLPCELRGHVTYDKLIKYYKEPA